jgi:glycosyltransferase involved in cell wall biosynthesis
VRVAVLGAIGAEKGDEVLLGCARDAGRRQLALDFLLVGYSLDDPRLLDTGRVTITGPYAEGEAEALLRRGGAAIGLLPSIVPETWCYGLIELWRVGLDVAVFDIGARRSGCGSGAAAGCCRLVRHRPQ